MSELEPEPESESEVFIDGVYNYCDRWCERCSLTGRCRVFAMEAEAGHDEESRDPNNAAFWHALEGIFKQTIEMLRETARKEGIDLDAIDREEHRKRQKVRRRKTLGHPLVKVGHAYAQRVSKWFESMKGSFEEKESELNSRFRLGLEGRDPEAEVVEISDAVEVIRWYQYQIAVKLARAVSGLSENEEDPTEGLTHDANGSAKVALLALDRSLAAWSVLRRSLPDPDDTILDFLVGLDRLRRKSERTFPDARKFVRPGFDSEGPG